MNGCRITGNSGTYTGGIYSKGSGKNPAYWSVITLNDTGAFLWEHLQEETDEAALVQALLAEYDVTEETAAKAVAAFAENLKKNHFLA